MRNLIVVLAFVLFSTSTVGIFAQTPEKLELPKLTVQTDFFVQVDRAVHPVYPDVVNKPLHQELELVGPEKYDISKVLLLVLEEQKRYPVSGNEIYEYLKGSDNLSRCLSLQDGLAIQAKGVAVFRAFFKNQNVFLWKSVVKFKRGQLAVPYLFESDGKVYVNWRSLHSGWDTYSPALMFPQ